MPTSISLPTTSPGWARLSSTMKHRQRAIMYAAQDAVEAVVVSATRTEWRNLEIPRFAPQHDAAHQRLFDILYRRSLLSG